MTNFDFLKKEPQFESFADVAVSAEQLLHIDIDACVLNCRRAMEFAVKWMYSVDRDLSAAHQDTLVALMNDRSFKDIVGEDIWRRMDFIRKLGNTVAHSDKSVTKEQAELCIENLFYFLDEVAYFYADKYTSRAFDPELLDLTQEEALAFVSDRRENAAPAEEDAATKEALTARRSGQQQTYVVKPLELSEFKTRKIYIDFMLQDAGWIQGEDWLNEVKLDGMQNRSNVGSADYVLYGDDGKALAVLEAKRTCEDITVGREQAKLYADLLEKKYGRRPVIFLSNGFETRILDGIYPERKVASVYSKRDLERLFALQKARRPLKNAKVDKKIADRYYQKAAIKSVCSAFDDQGRRKALLVMAAGSGKTRTVIALCDVLLRHGWIKNVLFLADRNSLVTQAMRNFTALLPELSSTNLCYDKNHYTAHCVFSTYRAMTEVIDSVKDENGKLFTCGRFDLVICDEAHRSIYNKYRDIITYFDAPLVGLTATPKDDIDKGTYEIFDLENGVPTYCYELDQAVKDGFLVDFTSVETRLKFIEKGVVYDELSDEDKLAYEDTFKDENGESPEAAGSSALNEWIFREDTIKEVLSILMSDGLKSDHGNRLGKTIIFAKNHDHAEKILGVFNREYPQLPGFASVIDDIVENAQSAVDDFSDPNKLPQIAVSADMLDTGIDVPEVLNLVFFKRVMSKAKFWQMIGRGTRLCSNLIDGRDKEKFYIFDFCGNFEFFRMDGGRTAAGTVPLQSAIFRLKSEIALRLQDAERQTDELKAFRKSLVDGMARKVRELNRENFAVRQHLKYAEQYSDPAGYDALTYDDVAAIGQELAPLIGPDGDDISAARFDALMYGIELKYLEGKEYDAAKRDLFDTVSALAAFGVEAEAEKRKELIDAVLHTDFLDSAGIEEFERIRICLRDLMKLIPAERGADTDGGAPSS